jgi:DNA-binding CsgD family transcriptional regulator
MKDRLQTIVEATPSISDDADLQKLLRLVRRHYEVDNCIYYALSLGGPLAGVEFGAMTYPRAWHDRYEDVRYRDMDPVVLAAANGFAPVDWAQLDWTGRPVQRLLSEACEFGVGNHGYTVPIHGPQGQFAMFSVSKQCREERWAQLLCEISQELLLIAHHVHRRALELHDAAVPEKPPQLSPRERDALSLMACGRSRAQIAHRLKISESTLRVYLDSARHKLGGLNAFHAVAIAVKTGSIKV